MEPSLSSDNRMPAEVLVVEEKSTRDLHNGHIVAVMCLVLGAMLALWVAGIALPRAH